MLGIRLEPDLERRLERLAKQTGRSKSYYAKLAIRQFLEDREDYLLGIAALERKEPRISLEDLEREAIQATLEATHYKIGKSASILGISRKTLLDKRKKYGLN